MQSAKSRKFVALSGVCGTYLISITPGFILKILTNATLDYIIVTRLPHVPTPLEDSLASVEQDMRGTELSVEVRWDVGQHG